MAPCTSQRTGNELFCLEASILTALKGNEGLQGGSRRQQYRQRCQGKRKTHGHGMQEWRVSGPAQNDHTVAAALELKHTTHIHMCYQHREGNSDISQSQPIQSRLPPSW